LAEANALLAVRGPNPVDVLGLQLAHVDQDAADRPIVDASPSSRGYRRLYPTAGTLYGRLYATGCNLNWHERFLRTRKSVNVLLRKIAAFTPTDLGRHHRQYRHVENLEQVALGA